jgi:hypothetical protein
VSRNVEKLTWKPNQWVAALVPLFATSPLSLPLGPVSLCVQVVWVPHPHLRPHFNAEDENESFLRGSLMNLKTTTAWRLDPETKTPEVNDGPLCH